MKLYSAHGSLFVGSSTGGVLHLIGGLVDSLFKATAIGTVTIHIQGAREHNLQGIDVEFGDGLTAVAGVSGSGKTSLVFDTLYHEAHRRYLDVFAFGSAGSRLAPAKVQSITGLGPAIAVGQNLLNRNPHSTLCTASGLHPFLRLLYARYGVRHCPRCGTELSVLAEDEIVTQLTLMAQQRPVTVFAPLLRGVQGDHRTLLQLLSTEFGHDALVVDGRPYHSQGLDPALSHEVDVRVARLTGKSSPGNIREAVHAVGWLGAHGLVVRSDRTELMLARAPICVGCGAWFGELEPVHFHTPCPHCNAEGCGRCASTGLHPAAAAVTWHGLRFTDLMLRSVSDAHRLFSESQFHAIPQRLLEEISRRLEALQSLGLGYISLDRPSPTLSRGETQRVRLAVALTSRLEDMLHILDEPTIGQHPADVSRLLPAFRQLAGPVVYVEHDRIAVAGADQVVDLGPGAGGDGGRMLFAGSPADLWHEDTPSGRHFSLRERVSAPERRPKPERYIAIHGAYLRNLKRIDVSIPLSRMTVVTGVSGSGKSTLVVDVLVASLDQSQPVGCEGIESPKLTPVLVDQSPIGRNPRSNPATYTGLSAVIRDCFALHTGLSASHFSFNRPEGACEACKGMGAVEVRMRYLPSTWVTCTACNGQRFTDEVLSRHVTLGGHSFSIADLYDLRVIDVAPLLLENQALRQQSQQAAERILQALLDVGLGYLPIGQPSPTLSGGEAQRVKLAKHLGKASLNDSLLVLDEPSTGLHPQDIAGLLVVLDRLVRSGATVVIVEHNTDIMRAADWVLDLGPGAGPEGGSLVYGGPASELGEAAGSITAQALNQENRLVPSTGHAAVRSSAPSSVCIRNARANNLKGVDVDIPKAAITVVTGVSGSGKSSLVGDVLASEARRRFLETLSLYERQGTHEGPEATVGSVTGLGVTITIGTERQRYSRRATVGTGTGISHHLAVLLASIGIRHCEKCGSPMERGGPGMGTTRWQCRTCHATAPMGASRHFTYSHYSSACQACHGVGSLQIPRPQKLIVHPERPLCDGAMYSPGFFPRGYLCKPFNGGYDMVQAIAARHGFDPEGTPWNQMTSEAQSAFLYGDPEPIAVTYRSRTGRTHTRLDTFPGFYGWIRDWDVGGTYTDTEPCPECLGARLRPEYLAVTLAGHNVHQLGEMPLLELEQVLQSLEVPVERAGLARGSLHTVCRRAHFLRQVGLGYLHLNRVSATLSAGEAQRVTLAGLLGSGLTSLTVLLDEPSRGLHPCEVEALLGALVVLKNEGNTVIVVEHDLLLIRAADYLVDLGPGAGALGGVIVAEGTPEAVSKRGTLTAAWLRGERSFDLSTPRRQPQGWLAIRGARTNNLRGDLVRLPLETLTGVCGVSGSGKSSLLIDTVGRALAPKKQTTSVAREPIAPGVYDSIEGAPSRIVLVDQARAGIKSPAAFLGLVRPIHALFAASESAKSLGLNAIDLGRQCTVCRGRGSTKIDMGFLPPVHLPCETCRGTGYQAEAWTVRLKGVPLPEVFRLTIDEIRDFYGEEETLERQLVAAQDVGLGYLSLRQSGHTLSGGEAQRLKIAKELCRRVPVRSLYILDEPTVGQHLEDVSRLVGVLHRLVDHGHTVVVIEHHPHVLAACDWLVELGPAGGPNGGRVIATGSPENLAAGHSPTAPYLRQILELQ